MLKTSQWFPISLGIKWRFWKAHHQLLVSPSLSFPLSVYHSHAVPLLLEQETGSPTKTFSWVGLKPSQHSDWGLTPWAGSWKHFRFGTWTHCLLIKTTHLASALTEAQILCLKKKEFQREAKQQAKSGFISIGHFVRDTSGQTREHSPESTEGYIFMIKDKWRGKKNTFFLIWGSMSRLTSLSSPLCCLV